MTQPGGADSTTDAAASEDRAGTEPSTRRLWTDWAPLLKKAPPWLQRVGSLFAAGFLLVAAGAWWVRAQALTNPCGELSSEVCDAPPELLQGLQFVLAIGGIAVAVLLAVLTLFQAATGRRVPRIRTVVATLGILAVAWGVVFVIGWFFLEVLNSRP